MKKNLLLSCFCLLLLSSCGAIAGSYKVNQSGVVKNSNNQTPTYANTVNQNYYNNYSAPYYVAANQVNSIPVTTIEFVMDYSGSMANWIEVAKRSMVSIISQIPQNVNLGFRVFGHDNYGRNTYRGANIQEVSQIIKKGKKNIVKTIKSPLGSTTGVCSATEQVAPVTSANTNSIISGMNSVRVGGATPLVYALDRAIYQDFAPFDFNTTKKIILITDGGENCGGDPCEFARQLMTKRSDVHIDVVLVSSSSKSLTCLASTTGGHFYNINNLSNFSTTINKSIQSSPLPTANTTPPDQNYEFLNFDLNE